MAYENENIASTCHQPPLVANNRSDAQAWACDPTCTHLRLVSIDNPRFLLSRECQHRGARAHDGVGGREASSFPRRLWYNCLPGIGGLRQVERNLPELTRLGSLRGLPVGERAHHPLYALPRKLELWQQPVSSHEQQQATVARYVGTNNVVVLDCFEQLEARQKTQAISAPSFLTSEPAVDLKRSTAVSPEQAELVGFILCLDCLAYAEDGRQARLCGYPAFTAKFMDHALKSFTAFFPCALWTASIASSDLPVSHTVTGFVWRRVSCRVYSLVVSPITAHRPHRERAVSAWARVECRPRLPPLRRARPSR